MAPNQRMQASGWTRASRLALCACSLALAACGPNYSAIADRLRQQTMTQEREISDLKEKLETTEASAKQLQAQLDQKIPRIPNLPNERLAQLFVPAKIEIRSQSDISDVDPDKGPTAFRVFVRIYDDQGAIITATGELSVEAFEFPAPPAQPVRIGTWKFTGQDMKKNWYSGLGLNHFAVTCPWQTAPKTTDVLFKVSFVDALTGKAMQAHLNKQISLPQNAATSQPAAATRP